MKQISFNPDIERYDKKHKIQVQQAFAKKIATIGFFFIISIIVAIKITSGSNHNRTQTPERLSNRDSQSERRTTNDNCRNIHAGYWDCTDTTTQEKASKIKTWYIYVETIQAQVTAYSGEESPGINAKGYEPIVGISLACPRRVPFGSRVSRIQNRTQLLCDDRTALKYDGRFDRFVGSKREALNWGIQTVDLTIFYPLTHPRIENVR